MLWGIYLGFFIYGLGIGFAMHAAPIYIAEIAPSDVRGTLVSAKELVIVGGIFLGFALSTTKSPDSNHKSQQAATNCYLGLTVLLLLL
ncbi:unnamed protein product [Polarella glacialis]|uniref:Major facilitator superfamily (MFS) profile domain-containing protein n=1 Tax=Polarella glacialis TaxID=89957 RepID=A0A813EMR5_POLGL|nr:unnamed protein product [Polarella glacialis]